MLITQVRNAVALTLTAMSVILTIVALDCPKVLLVYSVLHAPTCFLAGASTGRVSNGALMAWATFALVCTWVADSMLWHNQCTKIIGRGFKELAITNEDDISEDRCTDYIRVLRSISGIFAVIEVFYIMYILVKVTQKMLKPNKNDWAKHKGNVLQTMTHAIGKEIKIATDVTSKMIRDIELPEFILFLICLQLLRNSLHFIAIPSSVLFLPLAFFHGLHLGKSIKGNLVQVVIGATAIIFAGTLILKHPTCNDFFVVFSNSKQREICVAERDVTLGLLGFLVVTYSLRMIQQIW